MFAAATWGGHHLLGGSGSILAGGMGFVFASVGCFLLWEAPDALLPSLYTSRFVQTPFCPDLIKLQSGIRKKIPSFPTFASK